MKTIRQCSFISTLFVLFSVVRADTVVLSDDFTGASLDAATWTTILPYGSSSVTQSGGELTTQGRGILATAGVFTSPYIINGAFTMLNHFEHFNIAFRTDLTGSTFGERQGMLVSFSNDGDEISIQRYTSSTDWSLLTSKSYALTTGQTYSFSIFDDGTNVSLAVNGIDELSASNSYSTGSRIAFYSREFGSTATKIDAVTILSVPEAGTTVIYIGIGLGLLGIATVRKHQ